MRRAVLLSSCLFLLLSCGHRKPHEGYGALALSRCLEQAIESGEKALSQRELIENVALTEGPDAAIKLQEELHYRANYEAFWDLLDEADRISGQVSDSLERQDIIAHLRPYINRIIELEDEIRR